MSRHHFQTSLEGRPVTIVLGWDRPLRGYFCTVEREDATGEEEEYVYCNLDDNALSSARGFSEAVEYFDLLLATLGLKVSRSMVEAVGRDGAANVANRTVWYDTCGSVVSPAAQRGV